MRAAEALFIHGAHLDLTFAHSRFKARLWKRRRTINHAAISDIETRAVPRTLDHIAVQLALGQRTTHVRARMCQRTDGAFKTDQKHRHSSGVRTLHLAFSK